MIQVGSSISISNNLRSYSVQNEVTIEMVEKFHMPSKQMQAQIDVIWESALACQDSLLFDGTVLSVSTITPSSIKVSRDSYKSYFAQTKKPELYSNLGIRPLACSGFTRCTDGLIFGRRSNEVFIEPGCWELAPSGTFDAQSVNNNGIINTSEFLLRELSEELGVDTVHAQIGTVCGLFENPLSRGVDLAIDLELALNAEEIYRQFEANTNKEYSTLAIVAEDALTDFISQADNKFVLLSLMLLEKKGFL